MAASGRKAEPQQLGGGDRQLASCEDTGQDTGQALSREGKGVEHNFALEPGNVSKRNWECE